MGQVRTNAPQQSTRRIAELETLAAEMGATGYGAVEHPLAQRVGPTAGAVGIVGLAQPDGRGAGCCAFSPGGPRASPA
jgi:hypothetical protein